ncbi:hypothetical protein [Oryzihumus leptocrescens]|uniref:Uncharacterized protein n=1 Tax=Oryzihumus leptocrescens TaxID=297536 RepID=A0A542Z8U9_9MICO|nr:hypothetical protein [Oryzihumus leptocrescens]TQL56778.1 hypothetical protein FB474_3539 [Oryzihumus leptocrescens]
MVVRRRHTVAFGGAVGLVAVCALGGYLGGWAWTGFRGNTLWDWLHLMVLPVVLALLPLWLRTHTRLELVWVLALGLAGLVFVVLVLGGYVLGWAWTGFRGNTLWDWLELLVVPFVLPVVLLQLSREEERLTDPRSTSR